MTFEHSYILAEVKLLSDEYVLATRYLRPEQPAPVPRGWYDRYWNAIYRAEQTLGFNLPISDYTPEADG